MRDNASISMATEGDEQCLSVKQGNMHWLFRNVSRECDREYWLVPLWRVMDRSHDNDGVFHDDLNYTADEIIAQLWI